MLFKKLRQIKTKIFKQKKLMPPNNDTIDHEKSANKSEPDVDQSTLAGIRYLRQRLLGSQKRYFDSADHFLKLHEMEKRKQHIETTETDLIEDECTPLDSILETECGSMTAAAPLEAYSEIIDEMKPKESV
ncbi:hypothetical protein NEHOM01_1629 [Nematocida homosporus]|uniref:uncharacterized protein n=1 Tax=Nematocida homosporus TaxID=1912981 RepID=UPI00221F1E76|nr:uncharacterized protein NEHOM01_1629 [Nematocida homosporus]KAI5186676.1 hypothetical protein NEHOM01_1629 [Nematocida homosporus]